MGEYATRTIDNQEIKIGTCSSMYYLRYEDRTKVNPQRGSLNPAQENNLRFRIPFPDEDHILPGDYDNYNRGYALHGYSAPDLIKYPGNMQLRHDSGLLLNINCYHGEKLPERTEEIKPFWNGKAWYFYELKHIKNTNEGIKPVIGCRYCSEMWLCDWSDIMDYITDEALKEKFINYSGDEFFSNMIEAII